MQEARPDGAGGNRECDASPAYAAGKAEQVPCAVEVKGVRTRDYLLRKKLFLHMMRKKDIFFREVM